MWRTEKACESQERVIYGPLRATTTVVQQWYLGYSQKIPAYLLFAFVSHFIQHWCLSATCCIHQWSSWLTYKMLVYFSQSIYSYKVAGVVAMSSDVCSAGFCKMKSKLPSAHITVWITRWMQCNVPCISGAKWCLTWVGAEWNISTSGFDPVPLDDQQVSYKSYWFLVSCHLWLCPYDPTGGSRWLSWGLLEIPGTWKLGQIYLSTKLYRNSRLCWVLYRWWKNLSGIVVIMCLYALYKSENKDTIFKSRDRVIIKINRKHWWRLISFIHSTAIFSFIFLTYKGERLLRITW